MKSLNASSSAAGVPALTRDTATDHPHAGTSGDLFPRASLAELVEPVHGQPMTTSRRVAQMFGKEHKNVLRSVEKLLPTLQEDAFDRLNFEPITYTDDQGRRQPEYRMTKDGFMVLAMSLNGSEAVRWRMTFIKAFNALGKALQRQQRALMSRERELIRAEVARSHSAVNAILADTRTERGKTTEAHHYANEARLIGYAMTGQCIGIDRSTLDAEALQLLHRVETLEIKLLVRGADHDTRKAELRALVLKVRATAQALEAGDPEPLQSIGRAA
jgi:Rha family phage regulatory protein